MHLNETSVRQSKKPYQLQQDDKVSTSARSSSSCGEFNFRNWTNVTRTLRTMQIQIQNENENENEISFFFPLWSNVSIRRKLLADDA